MISLLWLFMCFMNCIVDANSTTSVSKDPLAAAAALMNNKMSGRVVEHLDQGVNMVFSGFSLGNAMGMLLLGSRGSTEEQIKGIFFQAENVKDVGASYQKLDSAMEVVAKSKTVEIKSVNRVYFDGGFKLMEEYLSQVKQFYGSEPKIVDYASKPEEARKEINSFVAEHTEDMITELLPLGSITKDTRVVLVNALYFKGNWEAQFDHRRTKTMDFHVTRKKKVKAEMMRKGGNYRMMALDKSGQVWSGQVTAAYATALRMPFQGGKMDMVFVLPEKSKNLEELEKMIYKNDKIFSKTCKGACNSEEKVLVTIPKFKMEIEHDLIRPLKTMGVDETFGRKADLSGISKREKNLYVSKVIQKCVVKVDEKGSEAAAATAIVVSLFKSAKGGPKPRIFKADKPFLFFIVESETGMILFSGRMVDPSQAKYDDSK